MAYDWVCQVPTCDDMIATANDAYCHTHKARVQKYGSLAPIRKCYGCGTEFTWISKAFRMKAYCDLCIEILMAYSLWLPKYPSSIQAHGINVVEYLKLLVSQEFRCAICTSKFNVDKRPAIDHDHSCCKGQFGCKRCIRGLLCFTCNSGIGFIESGPNVLDSVAIYQKGRPYGV